MGYYDDEKNYCGSCADFKADSDWCNHWHEHHTDDEEHEDCWSSSSSGCYLSTACCEHRGLPDDCEELTVLRAFRDDYLKLQPDGPALIQNYYTLAPGIVERIRSSDQKEYILEEIWVGVQKAVALIKNGSLSEAKECYIHMSEHVRDLVSN